MNREEMIRRSRAYLRADCDNSDNGSDSDSGSDSDDLLDADGFEAYEALLDLLSTDPAEGWSVLKEMILAEDDVRILERLGAGPLEGLLESHGPRFIDEVEALAKSSLRFYQCLDAMWTHGFESSVLIRISRIRSVSWRPG